MRKKIRPTKTTTPYTPWKLDLPKSLTGTRRVRKFFASKEEADAFLVRVRLLGFANAELRPGAGEAVGAAADGGDGGMTVAELCGVFLGFQETRVGAVSMRNLRYLLGKFEAKFARRKIGDLSHRELEAWLVGDFAEGASRFNAWRVARRVLEFARDWLEILPRNPMRKIPRPSARAEGAVPTLITAEEFAAALAVAEGWAEPRRSRWIAYLALGGLAGLRTAETLGVRWGDIDLEAGEIFVRQPKRVRGWMPRYVKILPKFAAVWKSVRRPVKTRGYGFELNVENPLAGGTRYLHLMRRDAVAALGWRGWPANCLRHSFATYHLAYFKNLAELRGELGHESESVTRRHYATAARGVDAAAWWKI